MKTKNILLISFVIFILAGFAAFVIWFGIIQQTWIPDYTKNITWQDTNFEARAHKDFNVPFSAHSGSSGLISLKYDNNLKLVAYRNQPDHGGQLPAIVMEVESTNLNLNFSSIDNIRIDARFVSSVHTIYDHADGFVSVSLIHEGGLIEIFKIKAPIRGSRETYDLIIKKGATKWFATDNTGLYVKQFNLDENKIYELQFKAVSVTSLGEHGGIETNYADISGIHVETLLEPEPLPEPEITIYRLENNICNEYVILESKKLVSDYDNLIECQEDIEDAAEEDEEEEDEVEEEIPKSRLKINLIIISISIIAILFVIIAILLIKRYGKKRRNEMKKNK